MNRKNINETVFPGTIEPYEIFSAWMLMGTLFLLASNIVITGFLLGGDGGWFRPIPRNFLVGETLIMIGLFGVLYVFSKFMSHNSSGSETQ